MALELGGHEDVARALCAAATSTSVKASERAQQRAEELLIKAEAIDRQIDSSLVRTNIASARAISAYLAGRLVDSVDLCAQAEHMLRMASADAEYHHRFTLAAARIGALMDLSQTERAEALSGKERARCACDAQCDCRARTRSRWPLAHRAAASPRR